MHGGLVEVGIGAVLIYEVECLDGQTGEEDESVVAVEDADFSADEIGFVGELEVERTRAEAVAVVIEFDHQGTLAATVIDQPRQHSPAAAGGGSAEAGNGERIEMAGLSFSHDFFLA